MKKRKIWIWVLLVVLLAAGGIGYRALASSRAAEAETVQTATITKGSLASTLSASGNTRSGQDATIAWQTSGTVEQVTLQPGDRVEMDQVLAALDPSSLSTELINARESLADAQQALEDLLNSRLQQAKALQAVEDAQLALNILKATANEQSSQAQLALANAEDALTDAQKNRQKMDYPHSSDQLVIEKAETSYLLAKKAYNEALKEYNKYVDKPLTRPERVQALNRLVAAKQAMNSALATWNWYLMGYSATEIAQADAELAVAQANLEKTQADYDSLKTGASQAEIALAEATLADAQREWERVKDGPSQAELDAAQAAVDNVQAILDRDSLLAPFAGTITAVEIKAGDIVSAGDPAFRIDDLDSLYIDLQISEVDLASLQVGQKATLEFDAIADQTYNGEVTEIGMIGSVSQGVVNYPVTVRITDADGSIRPGMTATVNIITAEANDVLMAPNKAIKTSGGQQSVVVLFEGQQISVPVTVGLVGDSYSEIVSTQLREGDVLVLNGASSTSTSAGNNTTEREFMGPMGDFGGGQPPAGMP